MASGSFYEVKMLVTMHAGLYLSFLGAISLLAVSMFAVYMALRLAPLKVVSLPQAMPTAFPAAQSVPNQPQPIADGTAEALMQADANLKKRIVKLATKVMLRQHTAFWISRPASPTTLSFVWASYQSSFVNNAYQHSRDCCCHGFQSYLTPKSS